MRTRPRWPQYLSLSAVYLGFAILWNSLHPIILPLMLLEYGSEATKNTRLGVLTFVGLLVAMVAQPLTGALSDRTQSRLGRRRPWILGGTALAVVALAALGAASALWVVAAAYLLLQVAANLVYGPANGLIPDLMPEGSRGPAAGVKTFLEMVGIVVAAGVTGYLMGGPDPRLALNLALIALVLVAASAVTVRGAREARTDGAPAREAGPSVPGAQAVPARPALRSQFAVRLSEAPGYGRLLTSRFWLLLSSYLLQSFGLYYFRDVLNVADPAATMGALMVAIGVSLALVALPAGALSERVGRRTLSAVACAAVALCTGLLFASRSLGAIRGLGIVTGLGMGAFMSVNWAWAADLVPRQEAGKYMGLVNLATAGPSALSRLAGPLVDLANGWRANAGYTLLFGLAVAAAALACVLILRVPETRGKGAEALTKRRRGAKEEEDEGGSEERAAPAVR